MPIRFSFDLGTNSLGMAVWSTGPDVNGVFGKDAPRELLWTGVRLFKDGRNPKDGQSLAAMRRIPKQARKRRDRFVLRRQDLVRTLIATGLMPDGEKERRELQERDPYQLRALGLDAPLTPHEFGRVIFHLNQRRGFRSNRKTDKKDKDKGKIAEASKRLVEMLKEYNCRTLGEFLWTRHRGQSQDSKRVRDPERQSTRVRLEGVGAKALYEFYPTREMIRMEFDRLWEKQAAFHPEVLTQEMHDRIATVLFRQRDLKPPKIGRCTFEPSEFRAPKALPSVQAREIYERLGHLRISTGPVTDRPLKKEERDLLASVLLNEDKMSFVKIRRALKLGGDVRLNFEELGEKELMGLRANKLLAKPDHYGSTWRSLPFAKKDAFVTKLLAASDDEKLIARLMAEDGLTEDAARNAASIPLPDGYSRLGKTANAAILEALIDETDADGFVIPYSEAVLRAGKKLGKDWHHSDERDGEIMDRLPYYGQVLQRHILPGSMDPKDKDDNALYWGRIMNPTVHIGLNQLRRVVNALIRKFGHPDQIVVELARELKMNAEQKERELKQNRANRDANEKRVEKLAELNIANDGEARARLKLFEEQQQAGGGIAHCPFSGRPIGIHQLFSPEIEVEHILPRSRTLDDGAANKVLCFRDMNRLKRGKTPFEAFGHTPDWPDIAMRAERLPPSKRWRFKPDAMDIFNDRALQYLDKKARDEYGLAGGFLARQLNETKYLSRLAKIYLGKICDPDQIYVTPGTLTGLLRGKWGLNSLLSDDNRKNRTDHRHHALDAVVIGAMTRGLVSSLARDSGRAEHGEFDAVVGKVPWPFEGFHDAVRSKIDATIVSNKPEHGKKGALHEDTAYGLIANQEEADQIGNLVRRKPLADLTGGEIDAIRDKTLREKVQVLAGPFRDSKGKIKDEKALAVVLAGFAKETGIRRVRVGKSDDSVVPIADRRTGHIYKAVTPGENHHIDVVQMRDGSWRGFAATVFDVNRKGWRPQWEREKLGGKLVMRLHKGDAVEVDDKDGIRRVKTVVRISPSNSVLYLVPHNEGGDYPKRHADPDDPFRWDFANVPGLKDRNCVAARVDEIGQLSYRKRN